MVIKVYSLIFHISEKNENLEKIKNLKIKKFDTHL